MEEGGDWGSMKEGRRSIVMEKETPYMGTSPKITSIEEVIVQPHKIWEKKGYICWNEGTIKRVFNGKWIPKTGGRNPIKYPKDTI